MRKESEGSKRSDWRMIGANRATGVEPGLEFHHGGTGLAALPMGQSQETLVDHRK